MLNSLKTVMGMIFPLITFPYVSRILGAANIGKVNYAQSIVSYFALFAGLGISSYAIREGARIRDDRERLTRFARQIFTINLITSAIAYIAFFITIVAVQSLHAYMALLIIMCLNIGFTTIGVDWLYSIYEDYFYLSIRTILVQFVSLILMFVFVHKASDFVIYAGITVFASSAANIWGFFHASKFCSLAPTTETDFNRHIKPLMTLFTNNIAITIYSNAGTTFVGAMLGDVQVGLYTVAMKVYTIVRQVINSLTAVSLPRLSYLVENDHRGFINLLNQLFNTIVIACVPATILVYTLREPIVLILSGHEYLGATPLLGIVAFALLMATPNALMTSAILIPMRRESKVALATTTGAVVNIGLDFLLIPHFGMISACYSILAAEFSVFAVSAVCAADQLRKLRLWSALWHALLGGALIISADALMEWFTTFSNPFVDLLVRGCVYAAIYVSVMLVTRDTSFKFLLERFLRRKPKTAKQVEQEAKEILEEDREVRQDKR
ncbi:polysaccharide biosynthesis protein [Bifidobacterium gallicum DSM 20093 = LMG 11596]|uniref:Polysaccharide biosynthesis protein n=2 Tax=Bifidobacterium gallicum DSM 20093 = LMG 11596 TaxID=561180 RepID=D1NRS6_9BIFI|nr:polysaccharide biosynthesis protein [Bifidobacterium gallicum DSM 20093 = LMG 11596]